MITRLPDSRVKGLLWTQTPFPVHGSIATLSPPMPHSRAPAAHAGPRGSAPGPGSWRSAAHPYTCSPARRAPRPWDRGPPQPSSSRQWLQTFRCTAATWETQKRTSHCCLLSPTKTIQNVPQEPDLSSKQPSGRSKHTNKHGPAVPPKQQWTPA